MTGCLEGGGEGVSGCESAVEGVYATDPTLKTVPAVQKKEKKEKHGNLWPVINALAGGLNHSRERWPSV